MICLFILVMGKMESGDTRAIGGNNYGCEGSSSDWAEDSKEEHSSGGRVLDSTCDDSSSLDTCDAGGSLPFMGASASFEADTWRSCHRGFDSASCLSTGRPSSGACRCFVVFGFWSRCCSRHHC